MSEDWRKANVTSIPKKNKREGPGFYRLFSITLITEMIGQLILGTISRHMKDRKVFRSTQHGFTKRKSSLTNLITSYDEMTGMVDEG